VPCPLNAGRLAEVVAYVVRWRQLAKREAAWQWRYFFETRGRHRFEASARAGWTHPTGLSPSQLSGFELTATGGDCSARHCLERHTIPTFCRNTYTNFV